MFLKNNSRRVSSINFNNLTRRHAYECYLPKIKQVKSAKVIKSTSSVLNAINPFNLYSLPSDAQIWEWKEDMNKTRKDEELCVENRLENLT